MRQKAWKIIGVVILSVGAIVLWYHWPWILKDWFQVRTSDGRGVYGDSFGALNTLFTGLAFIAVAITIYFQSEELRKLKEERKEDALESQFRYLNSAWRELVKSISISDPEALHLRIQGTTALAAIHSRAESQFVRWWKGLPKEEREKPEDIMVRKYNFVRNDYPDWMLTYYSTFEVILSLLDSGDAKGKEALIDILTAEMTPAEVHLIVYKGSSSGNGAFKATLQKYGMLRFYVELSTNDEEMKPVYRELHEHVCHTYSESAFRRFEKET